MYINHRRSNIFSKVIILMVALIGFWIELASYGASAWRLLETWLLVAAAIYCMVHIAYYLIKPQRVGRMICPMLQGALLVVSTMLLIGKIAGATSAITVLGVEGFGCFWINFLLPVMLLLDWIVFTKKGRWRAVDPWYWLALMIVYGSAIILTVRSAHNLQYPFSFLNYTEISVDIMVWWLLLVSVIILIVGYCYMLLDFALSGELGRKIVMPRIKTIIIEEEVEDDGDAEDVQNVETHPAAPEPQSGKTMKKPSEAMQKVKPKPKVIAVKSDQGLSKSPKKPKDANDAKDTKVSKDAKVSKNSQPPSAPKHSQPSNASKQQVVSKSQVAVKQQAAAKPQTVQKYQTPSKQQVASKNQMTSKSQTKVEGLKDIKSAGSIHGSKKSAPKTEVRDMTKKAAGDEINGAAKPKPGEK